MRERERERERKNRQTRDKKHNSGKRDEETDKLETNDKAVSEGAKTNIRETRDAIERQQIQ